MDTSKLKPANQNPWYILMTLYGEQEGDEIDWELAEKNRKLWNAWVCQGMDEAERHAIADKIRIDRSETDWTSEKRRDVNARFAAEWQRRNGDKSPPDMPKAEEVIDLSEIAFSNTVVLEKAIFGAANFSRATFTQDAYFPHATFTQDAYFFGAIFTQDASFSGATFTQGASFSVATFDASAIFQNADFAGLVDFRGWRDPQDDASEPAHFGTETIFSGAHFHKRADFFRRRFGPYDRPTETLTFANAIFDAPVSFEEAEFPHLMPVLTNTTLPESTKLTANRQNWPTLKPGLLARLDARLGLRKRVAYSEQSPEIVKASAASLRHAMARQMLPEEEHFFFRREMWGAARSGPILARPIIWLYGAVSNYGHSISRPAALLTVLWLAGLIIFAGQATQDDTGAPVTLGTWQAAFFSFANMFKFFGLLGTYFEDVAGGFPDTIQVAAGTQTVLAFILLFFLGLGLRTRFRLR